MTNLVGVSFNEPAEKSEKLGGQRGVLERLGTNERLHYREPVENNVCESV